MSWLLRASSVAAAIVATIVASAVVGACTSGGGDTDSGPLVEVATTTSTNGAYDVSMLAHSAAPTRGNHTIELVITQVADGAPADGLALTVVPWMPAMGHGTSITPTITPLGDGAYQLDDVDLFMAGLWEIRTTIAAPADYAAPSVQVQ